MIDISSFNELEARIKLLIEELRQERNKKSSELSSEMDSDKLPQIEEKVKNIIQLLNQI